jgi:hypothetical protein
MRTGTAITSMDAMYGTPTEAIEELVGKARNSVETFRWEDYAEKASDDSVQISDGTYAQILKSLAAAQLNELGLRIATDWVNRQPRSIRAFQAKVMLLRNLSLEAEAKKEEEDRLVDVEFVVTTTSNLPPETNLVLIGNASPLGNWEGAGLMLRRDSEHAWRAKASIPRGDLQFKVAGGSIDKVETRADGRNISNRRFRIQSPCEIRANVEALKQIAE